MYKEHVHDKRPVPPFVDKTIVVEITENPDKETWVYEWGKINNAYFGITLHGSNSMELNNLYYDLSNFLYKSEKTLLCKHMHLPPWKGRCGQDANREQINILIEWEKLDQYHWFISNSGFMVEYNATWLEGIH